MGAPSTATLTTAAYNTWAAANSQPLYTTTAGTAIYNQIVNMVNGQKTAAGALWLVPWLLLAYDGDTSERPRSSIGGPSLKDLLNRLQQITGVPTATP